MKSSTSNSKATILAISGSLRANSSNAAVLSAAAAYVGDRINFIIYDGLASIPPFDDSKDPPVAVVDFRNKLRHADGIFICSPEYAFGVSGVLKNAIDWTVSSGEFVEKPTTLITAATGGDKAHAALLYTFQALSASIPESGKLLISYVRSKMDEHNNIKDEHTKAAIYDVVDALLAEVAYQYL